MHKTFLLIGSILGFLSVALGAFGAHAFRASLEASARLDTYETAVKYQIYHALALVLVAMLFGQMPLAQKQLSWAGWAFVGGTLVFSGALYLICLTGVKAWGAVAPVGGTLLLIGWGCLLWAAMAKA